MRIGIDIDDTIADTYEVVFAYAQKYTINELGRSAEINHSAVLHHFYAKSMHNWTDEEEMGFWNCHYYEKIIKQTKPFTFAVETIQNLKKEKNEIILITARWPQEDCDVNSLTLEWLKKNNIPYDDIVLDASDKAKIAIEKKIDLFIDDSFKNCTEVANAGIKTFMMDTRTNKGLEAENITRVYSWPDIYNRIKFLK